MMQKMILMHDAKPYSLRWFAIIIGRRYAHADAPQNFIRKQIENGMIFRHEIGRELVAKFPRQCFQAYGV